MLEASKSNSISITTAFLQKKVFYYPNVYSYEKNLDQSTEKLQNTETIGVTFKIFF